MWGTEFGDPHSCDAVLSAERVALLNVDSAAVWTAHEAGRENVPVTAHPIWFGPEERPLFGWLHLPERAVAGVVLCLPIGDESSPAFRAYRLLAEVLGGAGIATLRFDYSGTGDSAGEIGDVPDVSTWTEDIVAAVEVIRGAGIGRVGLLGMRIGAILAKNASIETHADALVLWDPCETGRGFLREQRLFGATGVSAPEAGAARAVGAEIQGLSLPPTLAKSVADLELVGDVDEFGAPMFVLVRPERALRRETRDALGAAGCAWGTADDQAQFFDVEALSPYLSETSIDQIVAWCSATLAAGGAPIAPVAPERAWASATVDRSDARHEVVERPVTIGSAGLFAMLSEPVDVEVSARTVLLLNMGVDRHIGPSRLWTELGRRWAQSGARVLRLDLSGLGDSPPRPGRRREIAYSADAIDDLVVAARYLAPADPSQVLLVGACSGGYHAVEGAALLNSRAVWLINPALPHAHAIRSLNDGDEPEIVRSAARRLGPMVAPLVSNARAINLAHHLIPAPGWWLLDKLRIYTYPSRALRLLVQRDTETFMLCGREETRSFFARGKSELRHLVRSGRLHFETFDELDHSLLGAVSRKRVTELLSQYVERGAAEPS